MAGPVRRQYEDHGIVRIGLVLEERVSIIGSGQGVLKGSVP